MRKEKGEKITFELLNKIIKDNNIPENVKLMSDSGWECDATDMDGIYYSSNDNVIVFTQNGNSFESYYKDKNWKLLHCNEENK